jgi:hypothetical protein
LRYLLRLAELELVEREGRMVERRIRAAHFRACCRIGHHIDAPLA